MNHHYCNTRVIILHLQVADLENSSPINSIILNSKRILYLSKLENKQPSLNQVQLSVKQLYYHEKIIISDADKIFRQGLHDNILDKSILATKRVIYRNRQNSEHYNIRE